MGVQPEGIDGSFALLIFICEAEDSQQEASFGASRLGIGTDFRQRHTVCAIEIVRLEWTGLTCVRATG
jgi:hypothetical protein